MPVRQHVVDGVAFIPDTMRFVILLSILYIFFLLVHKHPSGHYILEIVRDVALVELREGIKKRGVREGRKEVQTRQ